MWKYYHRIKKQSIVSIHIYKDEIVKYKYKDALELRETCRGITWLSLN